MNLDEADEGFRYRLMHKLFHARRRGESWADILAGVLNGAGYQTEVAKRSKQRFIDVMDDHIDIVGIPRHRTLPVVKAQVINCKITLLRVAALHKLLKPGEVGWLLTPSSDIDGDVADYAAQRCRIRLIDYDGLIDLMMEQAQILVRAIEDSRNCP